MGVFFVKLLNLSITAGWLILVVLVVRVLFRRMPKWVNCLMWGAVALRLVLPFSLESVFSLQPSAEPIQMSTQIEGETHPYVPFVNSRLPVIDNAINPVLQETFAYEETDSVAPLQVVTEIAGWIWLVGLVGFLLFAGISTIRLKCMVREAVPYKKGRVYVCDAVKSPFILGLIRPGIYLPATLKEEDAEYILAHERAHLKRGDHLWKPAGYLLLSVYWFNPLCIVAYFFLCKDIELACDEKVIRNMDLAEKKEYSKVLLACATQRRFVMVCPLAFGEVGVKERVKSVLKHKKAALWLTVIAILVCTVVAVCFLTNPKEVDTSEETSGKAEQSLENQGNTTDETDSQDLGKVQALVEAWYANREYPVKTWAQCQELGGDLEWWRIVSNPPEDLLNDLSTEELVHLVMHYPLLPYMPSFTDVDSQIFCATLEGYSTIFARLLTKEERNRLILNEYASNVLDAEAYNSGEYILGNESVWVEILTEYYVWTYSKEFTQEERQYYLDIVARKDETEYTLIKEGRVKFGLSFDPDGSAYRAGYDGR